MQLTDQDPNVPMTRHPVYWFRDDTIEKNLATINRWIAYYTPKLPPNCSIDEAAVMVPSTWHARLLDGDLRAGGWEEFNTSSDLVYTNPFGTRYLVEYTFYRKVDVPYRLEIMTRPDLPSGEAGFSPLHASMWVPRGVAPQGFADAGRWPIPHLSFKPKRAATTPTREQRVAGKANEARQTWGQAYGQAVQWLKDKACIHAQSCQSTYGQFGYFLGNDAARTIYVKPRINTRDDQPLADCGQDARGR